MSDSPSPSWGPASYDDRDLDAVLSGELAGLPEPLLPVAGALAALRAAPAQAELAGEAAARAMFRAHAAPAPAPADRARVTSPAGGLLDRVPPGPAADGRPRPRPHSHRQRRPASRRPASRRRWPAVALLGGGAAAAAVACAAYAGVFAGPGVQHRVAPPRPGATIAQAPSSSSNVEPPILAGGGSKVPTPTPTPARTGGQTEGPGPDGYGPALCRELFQLMASPGHRDQEWDDYQQLAKLAGDQSVFNYCAGFGVGWGDPVYRYPPDHGGGPGGHGYGSRGHGGFGGGH